MLTHLVLSGLPCWLCCSFVLESLILNKRRLGVSLDAILVAVCLVCFGCVERRSASTKGSVEMSPVVRTVVLPDVGDAFIDDEAQASPQGPADLVVVKERLEADIWFDVMDFDADDCAFREVHYKYGPTSLVTFLPRSRQYRKRSS